MSERGYNSLRGNDPDYNRSTHTAGKMSPDEYKALRREFPELDKDEFDFLTGYLQDAETGLANRG
ncbi:MAG TPA: hypothetical protein VMR34_01640 [Candidatus Saccharimonadales bacterium]|nr:hypothetical protein [Candidatus Saccharimonadales bacterium]